MAKSPKSVFETIVSHGLGDKQIRGGTLGAAFRGVKETINELRLDPDAPTADPTLPNKVAKNTQDIEKNKADIKLNAEGITAGSGVISRLSAEVDLNTASIKVLQDAPAPEGGVTQEELSVATATLPYRLETDKVLRKDKKKNKAAMGGEIQLVDNLGAYHNVVFKGEGGVSTVSDLQGIVIDGSALMPRNLLTLPVLE